MVPLEDAPILAGVAMPQKRNVYSKPTERNYLMKLLQCGDLSTLERMKLHCHPLAEVTPTRHQTSGGCKSAKASLPNTLPKRKSGTCCRPQNGNNATRTLEAQTKRTQQTERHATK